MSVFNLSNAIMGSGILGLAFAMSNTGIILFMWVSVHTPCWVSYVGLLKMCVSKMCRYLQKKNIFFSQMLLIYLYLISIRQLLCVRFLHLLCSVFGYSHEWNLLRLETQPQGRVPRLPVHTSCVCIRTGTCGGTDQLCEFCSCPSVVGPAGPSTRAAYGTATLGRPVSLYIRAGTHAAPLNQIGAVKFRPWWSDPRHACLDLPRAMWRGGMERSWREVRLLMPNQTLLCGWKKKKKGQSPITV